LKTHNTKILLANQPYFGIKHVVLLAVLIGTLFHKHFFQETAFSL